MILSIGIELYIILGALVIAFIVLMGFSSGSDGKENNLKLAFVDDFSRTFIINLRSD